MPEHSLRFAVRDDQNRTTDTWKCWTTTGTGKRDVYLTSRPLGNALKLSLHEDGQWHIAFDSNRKDLLFSPEQVPASRFLGKWQRPEAGTSPIVLAARVHFPSNSPSETVHTAAADTIWLPSAPEGQTTEVCIFLINITTELADWPGKTLGTRLVGRLQLEGGGQVCLVHRFSSTSPKLPDAPVSPKYFRRKCDSDLEEANRAVAWGQEADGSISFIELPITVQRKAVA